MNEKRKITAVIFDLGGTLIYAPKKPYSLLKKKYPFPHTRAEYNKLHGDYFNIQKFNDHYRTINAFAKELGYHNHKKFLDYFEKLWMKAYLSFRKYRQTEQVLKQLRTHGYKIGLVSNFGKNCPTILDYHRLTQHFDYIGISSHERLKKPDQRFFKKVLKKLNVKPEEALMIGDKIKKDYLPAKALRMHALLLSNTKRNDAETIRDLKQIFSYIKKVNGRL
ncbi:MAG: HAD-IA family hydrolase [Nanoarchaeota archaeon]|nr:HAD-IA family hydrolase [Nanoarchaeota archaeon]